MKSTILTPTFVRHDERGDFFEMLNGSKWKNISYGKMKKGSVMGNHYHKKTRVFFFILSGSARIENVNVKTKKRKSCVLFSNEGILFGPYFSHAVIFKEKSLFLMGKEKTYNKETPDTYEYIVVPKKE